MLKFAKTDKREHKSTSSLESCATSEDGRQIIYRKASQQEYSRSVDGGYEETSSVGTNESDDVQGVFRTQNFDRELSDSDKRATNRMRYSTSDDKITRHVYSTDKYTRQRPHSSITEEHIDDLDNIDINHNIIVSDAVLRKKKSDHVPPRDVYIVGRLPRYHTTSLSYSEEYSGNDFNYGNLRFHHPKSVKSEGKYLTSIDVNENFSSPTTAIIRESPPPMRRRFITQPTTEYEHTPPEQLRNRSRDILRPESSAPDYSSYLNSRNLKDGQYIFNYNKTADQNIIHQSFPDNDRRRRANSDLNMSTKKSCEKNNASNHFQRFSEMRQRVKKLVNKSEKALRKTSTSSTTSTLSKRKTSKAESIDDCHINIVTSTSSPDSVLSSPRSINRSLTQSDRSFSADSDTQEITNRLNKIQFGKYRKNDICQFDFDSRETAFLKKPSPLSSTDSQYYGSCSSLSSAGFGHHQMPSVTDISALTSDMLVNIFTYLTTDDICRISRVCRRWYEVYLAAELWERISITNLKALEIDEIMSMLLQRLSYKISHACLCIKNILLDGCNKLTDNGIKTISRRCPELRSLEIAACFRVTNIGLYDVLTNCPNLIYLNASQCEGIGDFSMLPDTKLNLLDNTTFGDMRYIDFSGCTSLTDDGLRCLLKCTTMLEYLYLRQCDLISNIGLGYVSAYCQNLKELSLNDCYNITDPGVEKIIQSCSNLHYLSVAKCPISDNAVTSIATFGLQLRHLNLYDCENVTDVGIMNIANSCPRMRSLDLGKCSNITDATLYALSRCLKIRRLSLRGCNRVTDAGLRKLATHCSHLRHLDVRHCTLSSETFLYINRHCTFCDIQHDYAQFC